MSSRSVLGVNPSNTTDFQNISVRYSVLPLHSGYAMHWLCYITVTMMHTHTHRQQTHIEWMPNLHRSLRSLGKDNQATIQPQANNTQTIWLPYQQRQTPTGW